MRWRRWLKIALVTAAAAVAAVFFLLGQYLDWWRARPTGMSQPYTFQDGFENAATPRDLCPFDGSRWWGFQQEPEGDAEHGRVGVSTEQVRSGTQALVCRTPPNRGSSVPKADLELGGFRFIQGDDVYFSGWFFLAGGGDATHIFLWDLETTAKRGSPGRRLYLQSGEALASDLGKWWHSPTFRQPSNGQSPFPKDRWVRLRVHLFLSAGSDGAMQVWQDDLQVLDGHGQTLPTAKTVYDRLQIGLTANGEPASSQTLYVDDVVFSSEPWPSN